MTDVRQMELVPVGSLLLDPENPRLPDELDTSDQQELLRYFLSNYQPDEIAESMAENGYFSEEPLLVVPDGDAFVVVEGNRRLAALKLLTSPADRDALRTPTRWRDLAEVAQDKDLDQAPVVRYAARDELLDYLVLLC
jgi:hypothetical protein